MSARTMTEEMTTLTNDGPRGSVSRRLTAWRPVRRTSAGASCGSWTLEDNRTLRLRPGRDGLLVRCEAGTVLVTFRGDPDDHVLTAGEELTLVGRGLVVVWALSRASVTAGPARASSCRDDRAQRVA